MKGHVRKRGSKWCFVLDIGRDPETGKRRQKWFSGYRTKKEAEKALAQTITEFSQGAYLEPADIPYKDLLRDWLEQQVKPETSFSTHNNYERTVRKHITPALGNVKLDQLKPIHFQRLFTDMQEKGLSPGTVRLVHHCCRRSINWAVKMGMLAKNPVDNTTPPKVKRQEMKYWTPEQVQRFIESAKDNPYFPFFYVALFTGMRAGEIRGLKWDDIDWDNQRISIRRHITRAGKEVHILPGTKTSKSGRVVEISESVINVLKRHKIKQAEQLLMIGGNKENWVFTNAFGKFLPDITVYHAFLRATEKAGLPRIRLHDIRHTHATMLLQQGIHPKIVSERLGHSTVSMTLDIYSHVIPTMQKEAVAALDRLVVK
jgi:integrase